MIEMLEAEVAKVRSFLCFCAQNCAYAGCVGGELLSCGGPGCRGMFAHFHQRHLLSIAVAQRGRPEREEETKAHESSYGGS
jgi:hypothetical protein